jgi:TP901 family phage tail tape measure protein
MADAQSNIKVSIDTTEALASIKNLQRQISAFHTSMAKSGAAANAVTSGMQQNLLNSINATGKFSGQMKTIRTTTESFTNSLEKNKFSMGEYFRYAGGASKSFGRLFKTEFDTINKVARENVKDLQTQYIKMGRDANGSMKAIAVRPLSLDMQNLATKTMIASEKQALLNQLLKQGSTNLLNFGKNTQWAGRQLMVGFTIPLIALGSAASKTFMEMETQAIRFRKVYGDLFTPASETQAALDGITELGRQFTRYGVAVSATVGLAAEAAAAGFKGLDLQRQTTAATRLSILGQVDSQKALETTIALQNAFSMSSEDLAGNIDFLNAVENQTVLSLDDVSTAIPKAAPVIQQLGGDVRDLAFFMTAMKEGGINASEGANALKSGLASMINPTGKAAAMLEGFGINIKNIVVDNKGDLKKTVIDFATALNQLDPLNRAQAIEQMFGKFQFARLSTLFANVTKEGTQASRVLDLAGSSVQDLASLSEKELGMTSESAMVKFKASIENLKLSLVPVGEEFLKAVTPIAEFVGKLLDKFNNLGDGTKKIIVTLTAVIAGLGPVLLMTFGLLANGIANIIKGFTAMKTLFNKAGQSSATLGTEVKYMTLEQRNAAAVAASLDQVHTTLAQTFTAEATAVNKLTAAYTRSIAAQRSFMPTAVPMGRGPIKKRAKGKPAIVGGTGNKDSELSLLQPGETVIPTDMSKKYGALINGMIADNIPGYRKGLGTGTAVDIPGGFAAAHFGGSSYKTGSELLQIVEGLNTAFAKQIRGMVLEVQGGLDRVFTVFSNEVIATSTELNRAVGKTGTGKTAPIALAKRDLIGSGAASRDIELQRQLESAGVPIEEIRAINKKVTTSIKNGFTKLGNKATVTAEDLDKLVNDAYAEVSKTDDRVKSARDRMRTTTAVTDPRNDSRIAVSKDPYTKYRKSGAYYSGMESSAGQGNVPYQKNARFKITNAMADSVGLSSSDAATVYNQLNEQAKIALAKLKGDVAAFSLEFEKQATAAGLKIGKSYKTGIDKSGLKDIYVESRQRKSPHVLAPQDGAADGKAYSTAVQKSIDRQNRKLAKQGNSSVGGNVNSGTTILAAPSRMSRAKGAAGKVGSKFAGKTAGLGMAGSAAMMAGSFLPGKAGQIAQSAMPVAFGLQALQMALKLPIPHLKAVAGVALLAYGAFKLFNSVREKERLAIEGLGDAALVSEKKLKTLGDFFGVVPTSTNYLSKDGSTATGATPQEQAQIDTLQKDKNFQKDFKNDITSLKKGTDAQAKLVFDSVAIQLRGSGFAKEQIDLIIKALQEESGKTNVKFDFANIDLSTDQGILNFDKNFGAILKDLDSGITQTYTRMKSFDKETARWLGGVVTNISEEAKVNLKLASDAAAGFMNGLTAQLRNGTISADQFNQGFARISSSIATMPKPEQIIVLDAVFKTLPENLQKATAGMTNTGQRMEVLQAQALGLTGAALMLADAFKILNEPDVFGPDSARRKSGAQEAIDKIKKQVADYAKFLEKTFKANNPANPNPYVDPDTASGGKGLTDEEKYLKILEKQINALEAKRDAQKKINDEIQREIDLVNKLEDLSSQAVNAKISGNYIQAAMLGQQSIQAKAEFDRQTYLNTQQEPIDKLMARKQEIQDGSKLTSSEKAQLPKKTAKKANGGLIKGPGTGRSDSIKATMGYAGGGSIRVSNGEFVVKAASVRDYGVNAMNAVNNGTASISTNSGGTVYNINMPITSNSSDPKVVGDYVIRKLKVELDKNNKSNRVDI